MTNNIFIIGITLLIKAILMLVYIGYGPLALGSDEAQYWTWSQSLDWGYYSKPPGIAWEILFGTLLFGNSELGVRFGAVLVSIALTLAVYLLAKCCGLKPKTAFWAAIIMALTPLGVISSLFATTDAPFVLFWTLAAALFCLALREEKLPHYYTIGLLILVGALFKWSIYILWIFIMGTALLFPFARSFHLLGGFLLSLFGLAPSIIWNYKRHWPTFQHVWKTNIVGSNARSGVLGHSNFWDFIGAQAALLSPVLFILLLIAFVVMIKNRKQMSSSLLFCGLTSLILLIAYSSAALIQKIQGNWCVFAYPTAIVLLSWYLCERMSYGKAWLIAGLATSITLTAVVLSVPVIQEKSLFKDKQIPYAMNPFRDCLGWRELPKVILAAGYDPKEQFLFGDRYQMCSQLSFYGPKQKRAYFLNVKGVRKNQFSFWPGMAEQQLGKDGYFLVSLNADKRLEKEIDDYQGLLEPYFKEVRLVNFSPLFYAYGKAKKGVLVFKCKEYNGKEPPETNLY